jgi:aldose 1-epimerase
VTQIRPSGRQWTLHNSDSSAVVVEVGGGLRSYSVAGVEILDGYDEHEIAPACAGQTLAPWPNRVRDGRYRFAEEWRQLALNEPVLHNAIHGLVNWQRWELLQESADSVTVGCDLVPTPGYPWSMHLETTYTLGADGLRVTHLARNTGDQAAPFGLGTHPYLQIPGVPIEDLTLSVPARTRLLVDGRLLPIGAAKVAGSDFDFVEPRKLGSTTLDTAFGDLIRDEQGGSTVVMSAADGRTVKVWADSAFGWWQVFTSHTLTGPRHRRSIAVEPMTCPPDAMRSGRDLVTLAPGDTWQGTWSVSGGTAGGAV